MWSSIRSVAIAMTVAALALVVPAAAAGGPSLAVLELENRAGTGGSWWHDRGAAATQAAFIAGLTKAGFEVIDRERLGALMREHGLSLSGDVDPSTAMEAGQLLGVDYMLAGSITEYGVTGSSFVAAANARIFDVSTGEIVWADEARSEGDTGGEGSTFEKVMKPIVQELTASIEAADL